MHLWSIQEVFIPGQSQRTREHIVSASSLFWRIITNDPLNEAVLYSWVSCRKNIGDGWEERKMPRGSKG